MDYLLFAQGMMFVLCGILAWKLHIREMDASRSWAGWAFFCWAVGFLSFWKITGFFSATWQAGSWPVWLGGGVALGALFCAVSSSSRFRRSWHFWGVMVLGAGVSMLVYWSLEWMAWSSTLVAFLLWLSVLIPSVLLLLGRAMRSSPFIRQSDWLLALGLLLLILLPLFLFHPLPRPESFFLLPDFLREKTLPLHIATIGGCFLIFLGLWNHYHEATTTAVLSRKDWRAALYFGYGFLILFFGLLAGFWVVVDQVTRVQEGFFIGQLKRKLALGAEGLPVDFIARLSGAEAEERTEAHTKVRQHLGRLLEIAEEYRSSFLVVERDGEILYLADGEDSEHPLYSSAGTVYKNAPLELFQALRERDAVASPAYSDSYGVWISAFIRTEMPNARGEAVVFGMHRNLKPWLRSLIMVRTAICGGIGAILLVLTGSFFFNREAEEGRWAVSAAQVKTQRALKGTEVAIWEWDVMHDRFRIEGSRIFPLGLWKGRPESFAEVVDPLPPDVAVRLRGILWNQRPEREEFEMDIPLSLPEGGGARFLLLRGSVARRDDSGAVLGWFGTLIDITKRAEQEQELALSRSMLEAVAAAGTRILELPLDEVLPWDEIVGVFGNRLHVDRVHIFRMWEEEGRWFASQIAEWKSGAVDSLRNDPIVQSLLMEMPERERWLDLFLKGQPVFGLVRDLPEVEQGPLLNMGVQSLAVFPIRVRGVPWGVIGIDYCSTAHIWRPEEIAILESAANLLAVRIERELTEAEIRRKTREREATLEQAREAADAANRAKSTFLATMSHEIRTPLNAILGMSSLLQEANLPEEAREYAVTISQSGRSLLDLLNDILDYSKIEAGHMELEETVFRPQDLLDSAAGFVEAAAQVKGLGFRIETEGDLRSPLLGDPVRLRQVLYNLLSNALKFTIVGEIWLRVGVTPSGTPGKSRLSIEVGDTGIGMTRDACKRIFQPFLQADSSITRKYGGSGLGLAISRRLLDLMDGKLEAQSTVGGGSVFTVSVDLLRQLESEVTSEKVEDPSEEAKPDRVMPAPRRILLAEDNAINRKVARLMLAKLGQRPVEAENGREALEIWRREEFDLVLLDLQMPILDGLSAARQMRTEQTPERKIPRIYAFTANAFVEDRQACYAAGMDGVLTKPVTIEQLRSILVDS